MRLRDFLALWYMARVAGRYCPCEWPIKSRRLMHLCGRIDDAADRAEFRRFVGFHMAEHQTTTSASSAANTKFYWSRKRG